MSLDITIKEIHPVLCPHCNLPVTMEEVDGRASNGKGWYPFLESIGYYVPYDQRTEENDWYGKDMVLTDAQTKKLCQFLRENRDIYCGSEIRALVLFALDEGHYIAVNADW